MLDGDRRNLELAGLTDEEGRLRSNIPEQQGIIVCPDVKQQGDNIIFAIPDDWSIPLSASSLYGDINGFLTAGWQRREDTSGILEEVLDLANRPHKVLSFAKKWGPLWVCCDDYHMEEYGSIWDHYWRPENFCYDTLDYECQWNGTENIQDYINFSRKIIAVMNSAAYIRQGELIPSSVWLEFRGWEENNPERQKLIMRGFLSELINNVRLVVTRDLTLQFMTGFGFRAAVYLQLIQVVTGSPGLFTCDGCGTRYIRTGRKPARGRKNFCPKCSEGGRGSKKLWDRKKASGA